MEDISKQELKQLEHISHTEDRIVEGFGSVEIRDKDGEIIPMEEFKKVMPTLMKRGGIITDSHSNRHVGKILNYEFKEHPELKKNGLYLTYQIFKDCELDDQVWEEIKSGDRKGLSFGGRTHQKEQIFNKSDFGEPTTVLRKLDAFEFASVHDPCSYGADNVAANLVAKGNIDKTLLIPLNVGNAKIIEAIFPDGTRQIIELSKYSKEFKKSVIDNINLIKECSRPKDFKEKVLKEIQSFLLLGTKT